MSFEQYKRLRQLKKTGNFLGLTATFLLCLFCLVLFFGYWLSDEQIVKVAFGIFGASCFLWLWLAESTAQMYSADCPNCKEKFFITIVHNEKRPNSTKKCMHCGVSINMGQIDA